MKKIKIIFLFGILVFTFSSCQKCQDCLDTEYGGSFTLCEGDFNSNQEYQEEIAQREADGYECYE